MLARSRSKPMKQIRLTPLLYLRYAKTEMPRSSLATTADLAVFMLGDIADSRLTELGFLSVATGFPCVSPGSMSAPARRER
jgi:hypothetical protein